MGLILIHWPWLHIWVSMHSVMFGFFRRRSVSDVTLLLTSGLESGKGTEEEGMKAMRAKIVTMNNILDIIENLNQTALNN